MPDIQLDERTRKLIEAATSPNEIAELCLAAGTTRGDLTRDSLGNVVVNVDKLSSPVLKPGWIDFDDRTVTEDANPRPEHLEFRK